MKNLLLYGILGFVAYKIFSGPKEKQVDPVVTDTRQPFRPHSPTAPYMPMIDNRSYLDWSIKNPKRPDESALDYVMRAAKESRIY